MRVIDSLFILELTAVDMMLLLYLMVVVEIL